MKTFLVILPVIFLALMVAGYYGFVPELSTLLGADKPRDLGIHPTSQDLASAQSKSGVNFSEITSAATPEETLKFSGKIDINNSFTDAEMTAMALDNPWKYNFLKGSQVKFNSDGSTEMSGIFYADRLKGYTKAHGINERDIKPALDAVGLLPFNPPYYLKMNVGIQDGHMTMNISDLEIGKINLTSTVVLKENSEAIASFIQDEVINPTPGVEVQSLTTGNGALNYKGTFPQTISVAH